MKSRIKKESPLLIGYMINEINIEKLSKIANSLKITLKLVGREFAGEKIGFLAGFNGFTKYDKITENIIEDECLIMSGLSNKSMDNLLLEMKSQNINIPLKCIVTQYNQSWTLNNLIEELKKEHEKMNKFNN